MLHKHTPSNMTLAEHLSFPNGSYDTNVNTILRGRYAEHMKRWLDVFPLKQFLIINKQDFDEDPYRVVKKIEGFLRLPKVIERKDFVRKKQEYCWLKRGAKQLKCPRRNQHEHAPEEVITWLRKYYQPWNEEFFNMTGVKFAWDMTKT